MKKIIFILNIIFSTFIFAQNADSFTVYEKQYFDLVSYIPKSLESYKVFKPQSKLLQTDLNTISSLKLHNAFREEFKLSESDKKWLEMRIDKLATSLFKDGKIILTSSFGGYSGCIDKNIDTIRLNNINITILKFCHTCTDSYRDENFIKIFNDRMYSMMKIEPPNGKTRSFYGEYTGLNKGKLEMKLVLIKDRTFKFWLNKGHGSDFTEGLWKNKNDTLVLNSKILNKTNKLISNLSNAKWIEFNNLKFRLKKEKLTTLNSVKIKLKKTCD